MSDNFKSEFPGGETFTNKLLGKSTVNSTEEEIFMGLFIIIFHRPIQKPSKIKDNKIEVKICSEGLLHPVFIFKS